MIDGLISNHVLLAQSEIPGDKAIGHVYPGFSDTVPPERQPLALRLSL